MTQESYMAINKQGSDAYKRKNFKGAQRLFLKAATTAEAEYKTAHKDVSMAYYNAARAFWLDDQLNSAYEHLSKALDIDKQLFKDHPQRAYHHYRMAQLQIARGKSNELIFNQFSQAMLRYANYLLALSDNSADPGQISKHQIRHQQITNDFQAFCQQHYPDKMDIMTRKYFDFFRTAGNSSHSTFQDRVLDGIPQEEDPTGYLELQLMKLDMYYQRKEYSTAIRFADELLGQKIFDEAVHLPLKIHVYLLKGVSQFYQAPPRTDSETIQQALKNFTAGIEAGQAYAPDLASLYSHRGRAYFYLGKTQSAIKDLEIALQIEPMAADTNVFLAYIYKNTGEIDKAVAYITEAKRLSPNNEEIEHMYTAIVDSQLPSSFQVSAHC